MYSINIENIKNDIINKLIDDLTDYATSDEEKTKLKLELEDKIKQNTIISSIPSDDIEVDPESINKTMNNLYIDLLTAYGVLNSMTEELTKYNINYTTYIDFINSKIDEISDMIESCRHSLTNVYMPAFHIERFRSSDKFDKTRILQKGRYGGWIPSYCYVNFSENEHHITLPLLRQDNSLRYDDKVSTAYIAPVFQLGEGFIDLKSAETDIENCIDQSNSSFWSDTILSDAPLRVDFDENKPDKLYIDDNYYYGIDNGAVCELEINFESVNTVNEIVLNPFTKYPINIIAIRYKQTDDEDEPLVELVTPDNKESALTSKFTKSQVSFKFKEIICKKIYILFTQEHYERKTYVYNPLDVYKNDLWFGSKNDKRPKVLNAEFKPNYHDRHFSTPMWNNANDKVISVGTNDLSEIMLGKDTGNRKVVKYVYEYGFYNIACNNNHYDRTGIYVSKPIAPGNNIKQVTISTKEIHQVDSLGHHITDIEYYLSGSEAPSPNDWYPILPTGVKTIESELLEITGGTRAYLRFETDNIHCVMKNGEPIDNNSNDLIFDINERTGHIWCIEIANYDYDAVYSVKYDPIPHSDKVDFSNKISTSIETFLGKNKNSFKLSNEPFIDNTIDYCNIKLTDVSRSTDGMEIEVENVTNVANQSIGYKNFTNNGHYQFYVYKNAVYFNKEIPENFLVEISYRHLISKIRLKAIFRRNSTKDGWLTPILDEIEYDIETF